MTGQYLFHPDSLEGKAIACVLHEGHLLDDRRWDEWLALYHDDALFWLPTRRSDGEPLASPDDGVSLMYHDARRGLEERVARIRSGKTVTAEPLPRTTHLITAPRASAHAGGEVEVVSRWATLIYEPRTARQHQLGGCYQHRIMEGERGMVIVAKKIILMNEEIPTQLDFYCV